MKFKHVAQVVSTGDYEKANEFLKHGWKLIDIVVTSQLTFVLGATKETAMVFPAKEVETRHYGF